MAVIFGLIGLFTNRLKGLALIGVILAVAAICVWKFYYVPKIQKAAVELFTEDNVNKLNDALEELGDAVKEAVPAEE